MLTTYLLYLDAGQVGIPRGWPCSFYLVCRKDGVQMYYKWRKSDRLCLRFFLALPLIKNVLILPRLKFLAVLGIIDA